MRVKGIKGHENCTDTECVVSGWAYTSADGLYPYTETIRLENMNEEKEWWEKDPFARDAEWIDGDYLEYVFDVEKIISEAQRREREEIVKMVENKIQKGPGGHGQCCVCQTCKFFYEECVCAENRTLQNVINAIKEKK